MAAAVASTAVATDTEADSHTVVGMATDIEADTAAATAAMAGGGQAWRSALGWGRSPPPRTITLLRRSIIRLRKRIISRHHRPTVRRRPAAASLVTRTDTCARWIVRSRRVQAAIARATTVRGLLVGPVDRRLLPLSPWPQFPRQDDQALRWRRCDRRRHGVCPALAGVDAA